MQILQESFKEATGWQAFHSKGEVNNPHLVLVFGDRSILSQAEIYPRLRGKYPSAEIVICSTSGEIMDSSVLDNSIVATAIEFDDTVVQTCCVDIKDFENTLEASLSIVNNLKKEDLNHVFVVSDGQLINGSDLAKGLNELQQHNVAATGGLAGDGYGFNKTLVGLNGQPQEGIIVAIGFYGKKLKVGFGSKGGWDSFGPLRQITKATGNVLYEMDNQNALELYKEYLGEAANELPSSALFYPLSILGEGMSEPIVRTILSIDEEAQSMTFAGDIPEGNVARLMKHNPDKLIDGAEAAAATSIERISKMGSPDLALLVSCVGRKIVLGQNIDEEVEIVREIVGDNAAIAGFYSYGELAPFKYLSRCELHNQTMTITTFTEV